jgi:pimeloyl-ACP methyl ester carboxylesterase
MTPSEYLIIQNNKLALYERPGDKGAIFFVHGNSSNAWAFEHLWTHPALNGFHLLAVDLPGHGKSEHAKNTDSYTVLNLSKTIAEVIEKKNLHRAVVVAHSLGGHVGIHALEFTQHIAGIMLMGTGPVENVSGLALGYNLSEDIMALFRNNVTEEELEKALVLEVHHSKHQQIIKDSFWKTDGLCREVIGNDIGTYFASEDFVSELKLLSNQDLSVALVQGEYDKIIKLEYLENLKGINVWKNKVHIIKDSAHCAVFENPQPLAILIGEFASDVNKR